MGGVGRLLLPRDLSAKEEKRPRIATMTMISMKDIARVLFMKVKEATIGPDS